MANGYINGSDASNDLSQDREEHDVEVGHYWSDCNHEDPCGAGDCIKCNPRAERCSNERCSTCGGTGCERTISDWLIALRWFESVHSTCHDSTRTVADVRNMVDIEEVRDQFRVIIDSRFLSRDAVIEVGIAMIDIIGVFVAQRSRGDALEATMLALELSAAGRAMRSSVSGRML